MTLPGIETGFHDDPTCSLVPPVAGKSREGVELQQPYGVVCFHRASVPVSLSLVKAHTGMGNSYTHTKQGTAPEPEVLLRLSGPSVAHHMTTLPPQAM